MDSSFQSLTHGSSGLALAYVVVLVPMGAALLRARADLKKMLLSPLLAVPVMLLAALIVAIVHPLLSGFGAVLQTLCGVVMVAAIAWFAGIWLARRTSVQDAFLHLRGAVVSRAGPPGGTAGRISLAGVPIPLEDETKHFKLIGTTGTGKSTAIQEILTTALARGDRAIIADPDGGYRRRFFDATRGDVVLNPFDPEGRHWDLFGEIRNDYDVEQLARSLIPDSGEADRTWTGYARTFFTAVTQQAMTLGVRDDAELCRLLLLAELPELRTLLPGTAAGAFVAEDNEKMFRSIRSVVTSALSVLRYTTRQQTPPLSVRQWVRNRSSGGGVLFLPYSAGQIAALASLISAWMRLGIFEALDQPEGDQRLWFIIDELDALGAIDGLKDALARLRKFGGRCVLGFQSISQVSRTNGRGAADTIVENCGNSLILRCSGSEHGGTSEFASKLIGQREVIRTSRSRSRRPLAWFASTTHSEQLRTEAAVMASEIERLPDLQGFLKVASVPDWRAVTLSRCAAPSNPGTMT
jgi:type IV secretory pathway TraG/TraD family ATPase VirD4